MKTTLGTLGLFLVLACTAGCGMRQDPPLLVEGDPAACAIALASQAADDPADQTISRLQERARTAADPLPYLERLGWEFVGRARRSFDPGFYVLAEQCASCIESKQPGSFAGALLRGHVLANLHRFEEAEQLARRLVDRRGLWLDWGLLGDALMEQGDLGGAVEAYQEMMDQRPGPQAYSRAAHLRWLTGDLSGAIEMMRMSAGATGARDPEPSSWADVRLAHYHLEAGDLDSASRRIDSALARQADYPPALLARGRLLLARGNAESAIAPLALAVLGNPLPEFRWVLIEALRGAGRQDDAREIEEQLTRRGAIEDARTYSLYLSTTGQRTEMALRLAQQELESRADVFTLDAVAWALASNGRHDEAQHYSRRALSFETSSARLHYHAGSIARALGNDREASRRLEAAARARTALLPSELEGLAREIAALPPGLLTFDFEEIARINNPQREG